MERDEIGVTMNDDTRRRYLLGLLDDRAHPQDGDGLGLVTGRRRIVVANEVPMATRPAAGLT